MVEIMEMEVVDTKVKEKDYIYILLLQYLDIKFIAMFESLIKVARLVKFYYLVLYVTF
jgi:hypothetical protein